MPSKKELRQLAIQREQQRRNREVQESCPLGRPDFEDMIDHVSDDIVINGHKKSFEIAIEFLESRNLPVEATISFLNKKRIKDDWDILVSGDAHNFFGPSGSRLVRMPLEQAELEALLDYVDAKVQSDGCAHTHRLTVEWLVEQGHNSTRVIGALMALGGFCDCEVAMNVEPEGIYK